MERLTVKQLFRDGESRIGREIQVSGWIRTLRDAKTLGFIEFNDGSFFKNLQIVFDEGLPGFQEVLKLGTGSAITAEGTLVESPGAKQPFELKAEKITVEGEAPPDYPLQKKRHTLEYLRTIAHLRPRANTFAAVFRVRSIAAHAIHSFFHDRGFVYVQTPIITASDCEGAGEMFRVTTLDPAQPPVKPEGGVDYGRDFFGRAAFLTVSGQLNAEAYALAFRNVYTFGPTFRAENSNTPRHAAEFWMIEPEMAFTDLEGNMRLAEEMVKSLFDRVLTEAPEEMEFFNAFVDQGLLERLRGILGSEFARVTYTEAVDLLQKSGVEFVYPVKWGVDLQTEHERYLTERVFKRPVFVIDYPREIKAFYMRQNDDGRTVAAMDLLVPGVGEIIGGSQREERYDFLLRRIEELGFREEDYRWYLELRRFGGVKHAGFGLGFERAIMYLTGMQNIRDVIPFPRTTGSAEF
ncbi:MAG: asparagine--tRNA ligase [Patescibacteria group bacterium]